MLSKEKFFYDVYKPSIGGDAGLLSFFPSGGRGQGQVDGSPRVPDFNQFLAGESSYSHRHDGKVYGMRAIRSTSDDFNSKYNSYVANEEARIAAEKDEQERQARFTSLADQIRGYTNVNRLDAKPIYSALDNLSAARNFGASELATRMNFQVSDQQILDDLNAARLQRLNNIVQNGNAQIVGIQQRIDQANALVSQLPTGDSRRTTSEAAIATLTSDLKSVNDAISEASKRLSNYQPVTSADAAGQKEISNFREFIKLPEERSLDQIRQIDPDTIRSATLLGDRYRQLATEALPDTTDPRTEQLRGTLEDEALNQLRLGSTLDEEVRRNLEQNVRAAQTARGNIFGVAPAVEEAMQTGLAGEQRKLARYGAAAQFLGSGQSRSDALRENLAFRDTLTNNRLGQAANFLAGGPSLYNLAQARTTGQQNAFANYINANMANPGQFNLAPSTAQPFYQVTDPNVPTQLTQTAASIYNTMQNAQASMYGNQVGAIASSYRSPAQNFASIAGGFGSIFGSLFPKGF